MSIKILAVCFLIALSIMVGGYFLFYPENVAFDFYNEGKLICFSKKPYGFMPKTKKECYVIFPFVVGKEKNEFKAIETDTGEVVIGKPLD